jgi:deoxyribodipyrimidine photolyase-like uncharacterized protein
MEAGKPVNGQWNFDSENRKITKNHKPTPVVLF